MFRLAHDGKGLKIRISSLSASSAPTSIEEPPPPSLGAAGTHPQSDSPRASVKRICQRQRSRKLSINGYWIVKLIRFTIQGTVSQPQPHGLNSLRRKTMKIGLVGRSGIVAVLAFAFVLTSLQLQAQYTPTPTASASSIPEAQWLKPEALLHMQQAKGAERPLICKLAHVCSFPKRISPVRNTLDQVRSQQGSSNCRIE